MQKKLGRVGRIGLLAALLCGLAMGNAQAETGDRTLFPLQEQEESGVFIQSIASLDGTLYLLSNENQLYRWAPGEEKPALYCALPKLPNALASLDYDDARPEQQAQMAEIVTDIATGDGKLWAFNWRAKRAGEITEQGVRWLEPPLQLSEYYYQIDENVLETRQCRYPLVREGQLYLLRSGERDSLWPEDWTLLRIDLATGACAPMELENSLNRLTGYNPGKLLGYSDAYDPKTGIMIQSLWSIDAASGEAEALPIAIGETRNMIGMAYDEATDSIYYLQGGEVFRSAAGGPFATAGYVCRRNEGTNGERAVMLDSGTYVTEDDGSVQVRDVRADRPLPQPLRIQGGYTDSAYQGFIAENPGQPVLLVDSFYPRAEDYAQAIREGVDLDLFVMNASNSFRALANKGFAADLSGIPALTEAVSALYPAMQSVLCDDQGRLMALPVSMDCNPWVYDPALWAKAGLGELPTTFDEFLDLAQAWEESEADHPELALYSFSSRNELFNLILDQYIVQNEVPGQPLDFDTPTLRRLLERIDRIPYREFDWENMSDDEIQESDDYVNRERLIETGSRSFPLCSTSQTPMAPLRFESDESGKAGEPGVIAGSMQVMLVNPNSKNLDAALRYAQYAWEHMEPELLYALRPDLNEPLRYEDFDSEVAQTEKDRQEMIDLLATAEEADRQLLQESIDWRDEWLSKQDEYQWRIPASAIETYRKLAPQIVIPAQSAYLYDGIALPTLRWLRDRYLDGQMTLDEFLRELNAKTRMMILEGD